MYTKEVIPQNVTEMVISWYNYWYLDADGSLFVRGNEKYGFRSNSTRFVKINQYLGNDAPPVKSFSSAGMNVIIQLEDGRVFVAGRNGKGQLGYNSTTDYPNYYQDITE